MPDPTSARASPLRRALFVDRDGTLNPDLHYLKEADRVELYAGVGAGLALAHAHDYLVVCVTNQSGIERGLYTREEVEQIHVRINELLQPYRTQVDAFYYCPHAPESNCRCRKPATGLFEDAQRDLGIDFGPSAILGDRPLDIQAGVRLGLLTALVVPPGHETTLTSEVRSTGVRPDLVASTFLGAVLRVLARG
ncbi:MAG: HAD family hydrolase [Thermoplasmata archaeon]|nr:HAD family hydrolase [Thermoplasmata archaeon]